MQLPHANRLQPFHTCFKFSAAILQESCTWVSHHPLKILDTLECRLVFILTIKHSFGCMSYMSTTEIIYKVTSVFTIAACK